MMFFSLMSLLDALKFTIQDLSNPKEKEREIKITNLRN
jgi:hypothetical protein